MNNTKFVKLGFAARMNGNGECPFPDRSLHACEWWIGYWRAQFCVDHAGMRRLCYDDAINCIRRAPWTSRPT